MTRKDSEKDSERPHYYSQFWLDVAAGRRTIGMPKTNEEADLELEPEPVVLRKSGRNSDLDISDGHQETIAHPEVESELEEEEHFEPEIDEMELEHDLGDTPIPDEFVDEIEIPDVDLAPVEEDEDEFFDEEEDEDEWSAGRGRKKPKPGRQVKQPKKPKRDSRRGF